MKSVRTYLAGLGSGGALLAAAVAAFLTLGALVAFDGLPSSSAESNDSTVLVDTNAPEIAAASASDPAAVPAATPAALPAEVDAAASASSGGGSPGSPGPGSGAPGERPALPPGDGGGTVPPATPPAPAGGGDVAGVAGEVDEAVSGATGVDLGLGKKTKDLTDALDKTIENITGGRGLGLGRTDLPDPPRVIGAG